MQQSSSSPSVLCKSEGNASPVEMDSFGISAFPGGSSPNSRRQRISMACQYCRRRKIRCCGGSPCQNCFRSNRECDYSPVPEEVNRATREKKAIAKASKTTPTPSPAPTYSSFMGDTPVFDIPYLSGPPLRSMPANHGRSVSFPNYDMSHWVPPPAPSLHSPAMVESSTWMYSTWSSAPAIPEHHQTTPTSAFPSVLEHTPTHEAYSHTHMHYGPATPADSRSSSTESDPPVWTTPTPSSYLHHMNPINTHHGSPSSHRSAPITPASAYHPPFPTPPLFHQAQQPNMYSPSPLAHSTSPTLAPEMSKDLVGLGIGTQENPPRPSYTHTPTFLSEEYFVQPHF